jgi:hypothetical protein
MALEKSETKGAILMMGIGLLTMVGVTWGIFVGVGRPIDGAAVLAERFAYEQLPFELEVVEAHRLASGDRMVRLARPEAAAGADLPADAPQVVIAQFHEEDMAPGMLFPDESAGVDPELIARWEGDSTKTFRGEINRGQVEFGSWSVLYIRDRLFRDTGKWVDSMRVNLSSPDVNCVLFVEFPPEVDASEARLAELLEGLELRAGGPATEPVSAP